MSSHPENLDPVQRLLNLKRHEVPPPGYFRDFSGRVIARLEAAESSAPRTWLQRLGLDFDLQPAMVCALGTVVSALFLFGVLASLQIGETSTFAFQPVEQTGTPLVLTPPVAQPAVAGMSNLKPIARPEEIPASTFPVVSASASASPFSQFHLQVQRTSWSGN